MQYNDGTDRLEFWFDGVPGYVPEDRHLTRFADAAAEVALRAGETGPVALLAQWDERAYRIAEEASHFAPSPLLWPAYKITGRDLPAALGIGLGACMYFGHGHAGAWDGYWGIDAAKLAGAMQEPLGVVFSLTCFSNARPPGALSFCEELVLSGCCAAAYGSGGHTSHRRNGALGIAIGKAAAREETLAGVLRNCGASWLSMAAYRVVGDPAAVLRGSECSRERARGVESGFWVPSEA